MRIICILLLLLLLAGYAFAEDISLAISVRSAISDDDWRHIAKRYDFVQTLFSPTAGGKDLSGENGRVKWIKSLNPDLQIAVYGSAINAANLRLNAWRQPREHPDWFLKNEAGEWVTDWEYRGALHLDPGNKEWQSFMAQAYKDYITKYGYDGVFVDLVSATTHDVNFDRISKALNPRTGKAWTDAEWKAAMLDLLRTVRLHIGDRLIIINGCRGRDYFHGYSDFLAVADGMCNEAFTGWRQKPGKPAGSDADWKADVDALVDCAKCGKIVFAVANVMKPQPGESTEAYEELYRFITASFLLGVSDRRQYLWFYAKEIGKPGGTYASDQEVLPAAANVSLGKPAGGYTQTAGGVYQRDFERGKVLVNPTYKEVLAKLHGSWRNDKGEHARSPLTMPARTGVILMRD